MGDDQESTDFGKCLEYIERKFNSTSESLMSVVVYGSLGGRVDQALHSIHQLYVTAQSNSQRKLYLTSEESMSFALEKGENIIHVPRAIFGITCGIIPVGGRSVISTLGLEWDVADWETSFGGRMSTSNHLKADTVVINTEEVVVFTVEVSADRLMSVDRLVSVAGALLEES